MINQVSFGNSREIWEKISQSDQTQSPFTSWQWHNDWFSVLSGEWKEFTLLVDDTVLAPFARKGNEVSFSGGDEIADYLDIIGPEDSKHAGWEQILSFLRSQGVTDVRLRNVPENSSTIAYFQTHPATTLEKEDTTPNFTLPPSWEEYSESLGKKYRHELERKLRKFEREHIDAEIVTSTNPEADMPILFSLMEKDDAKKIFLTADMKRFFLKIAGTFRNEMRLQYITLGDKKISAIAGFITGSTYYLYNSGFDKECCNIAGFYLKAKSIQSAIGGGVTRYNFLQGNERYKYELGGKDFFVYSVSVRL